MARLVSKFENRKLALGTKLEQYGRWGTNSKPKLTNAVVFSSNSGRFVPINSHIICHRLFLIFERYPCGLYHMRFTNLSLWLFWLRGLFRLESSSGLTAALSLVCWGESMFCSPPWNWDTTCPIAVGQHQTFMFVVWCELTRLMWIPVLHDFV